MMKNQIAAITGQLRDLGVSPSVLRMVKESVTSRDVPSINKTVTERIKKQIAETHNKQALVVLARNGKYRVFSTEGHAALRASAKKHKPWVASRTARIQ